MTIRLALTMLLFSIWLADGVQAENWPMWRGPRGDGVSREEGMPTHWSATENIAWKTEIPGIGHASPIVWNDRLFVTTSLAETEERVLLCLQRASGKIVWRQTVIQAPLEKKHQLNSHASGTPATDGKLVYVTFLETQVAASPDPTRADGKQRSTGQMVVAAFDFDGERRWITRPGKFASIHGYCSSPVLFEDLVIVNGDHDGDGAIVALDAQTGEVRWKVARDHHTRSYCTPIIRELAGKTQMVLSGSKCVTSYDPRTGDRHWYLDGPTEQFVASLVDDGELLYLTAGFPEHHLMAIKPDGRGQIGDEQIAWRTTRGCSYVPSPIVVDGYFLVAADNGIGSCFEAKSGERLWMERMGRHYSASLTAAGGLVYFLADTGVTKVVRPAVEMEVIAENDLGEPCYASPALSQGQIFLRGEKHLFCIGGAAESRSAADSR